MTTEGREHRFGWFGLALALLLAGVQIVGPAACSPLGIDEQVSYYIAEGRTPDTVFQRATQQSATPPLYFWFARFSNSLLSGTPLAERFPELGLRLPSLAFALLAVLLAYRMGQELLPGAGPIAALLIAGHSQFVYHATQARPYALGVFANLLAGWCIYRLAQRRSMAGLVGLLVANGLLLWSHYLFAAAVIMQTLLWLVVPVSRTETVKGVSRLGGWLASGACLLLPAPLIPALLLLQSRSAYLNWVTETRPWTEPLQLLTFIEQNPKTLAAWFALLVGVGVAALLRLIGVVLFGVSPPEPTDDTQEQPQASHVNAPFREWLFLTVWALGASYLLWGASLLKDPTLSQARYFATQIGPTALLAAWLLRRIGGSTGGVWAALVLLWIIGAPNHVWEVLNNPVRHDRFWLDAALLLNDRAGTGDVIMVQSGLVETKLVPLRFEDEGFQEYTTSRLSDFYLHVDAQRLSLPLIWPPPNAAPNWRLHYEQRLKQACAEGKQVWVVLSADSDIGEMCEQNTRQWLTQVGFRMEVVSDLRVARILEARCADP